MHRHSYQGRKFHRESDQRKALIKSLAEALIINESIETTVTKAKELRPYVEKLVTKAKKSDLHSRRQVISSLQTTSTAHKLVDEIAPKLSVRDSGYLRIEKTTLRRGDNTQMARISFVDDLAEKPVSKPAKNEANSDKEDQKASDNKLASPAKTKAKVKETK
ncbi:50S ribosomal protein L17 [Candidatus Saccharibacteria bacterium]|nr:50S ribosomal protein L17 [Candidatus Saccharibacteria bacterium]